MDIELLSKMLGGLILDNEKVGLPGLGTFVSEFVPASFSDKGYTINPPYKRLVFSPEVIEDDLLVDLYASDNSIGKDQARTILENFLQGVKTVLKERKTVVLPGLGRLRATKTNAMFFVSDPELQIYPDGFALESVSLRAHEQTPETFAEEMKDLEFLVNRASEGVAPAAPEEPASAEEPAAAEEPVAEFAHQEEMWKPTPVKKRKMSPVLVFLIFVVLLALLLFGAFILTAQIAPDFIDSLLYTAEELAIINA